MKLLISTIAGGALLLSTSLFAAPTISPKVNQLLGIVKDAIQIIDMNKTAKNIILSELTLAQNTPIPGPYSEASCNDKISTLTTDTNKFKEQANGGQWYGKYSKPLGYTFTALNLVSDVGGQQLCSLQNGKPGEITAVVLDSTAKSIDNVFHNLAH